MLESLKFIVIKEKENIQVFLMKNKDDNTYSYVNMTKGHICPCKFKTIEAAIKDMEEKKKNKTLIDYYQYN